MISSTILLIAAFSFSSQALSPSIAVFQHSNPDLSLAERVTQAKLHVLVKQSGLPLPPPLSAIQRGPGRFMMAVPGPVGSPSGGGGMDNPTYQRLTQAAWFLDTAFKPVPDFDSPDRWTNLTSDFQITKGSQFCIDNGDCWLMDKIVGSDRWMVQANDTNTQQAVTLLRLLDSGSEAIYDLTYRMSNLPNVASLIANGQFQYHSVAGYQNGFVLATELPVTTLENEIFSIVNGNYNSQLFQKPVIQKILRDVISALQQIHKRGVRNGPRTSNIFLYPGSPYTAKMSHFDNYQDMKNIAEDALEMGDSFLDYIVATLYNGAWHHSGNAKACSPPPPNNAWLVQVCDITENLDRISQNLQSTTNPWTLEQVLADAWMNS